MLVVSPVKPNTNTSRMHCTSFHRFNWNECSMYLLGYCQWATNNPEPETFLVVQIKHQMPIFQHKFLTEPLNFLVFNSWDIRDFKLFQKINLRFQLNVKLLSFRIKIALKLSWSRIIATTAICFVIVLFNYIPTIYRDQYRN